MTTGLPVTYADPSAATSPRGENRDWVEALVG